MQLTSQEFDGKYSINVECERYFEGSSSIYVTLNSKSIKIEGPVFVGSSSEPNKLKFTPFKYGQLIGVYWEDGKGKKILVYIYSLSDSLGWSRGKEGLSSDQLHGIKRQLQSQDKNEIATDIVFGEVEN